jgi:general L-amino acid transport system substrate-binding protein
VEDSKVGRKLTLSPAIIKSSRSTLSLPLAAPIPHLSQAISAALFNGETETIEYTDLSASERFIALNDGRVDLLSRLTTVTLERDVNEPSSSTGSGFTFSQPNFYDGMTFGGIPPFAQCADDLIIIGDQCQDIRICVNAGTTFETVVQSLFPQRVIVARENGDAINGLVDGACNVIAGGVVDVSTTSIASTGYDGPYAIGTGRYSRDPLALVTRQNDHQWSQFVNWIVEAIFYAEEVGITSVTASNQMPSVELFGPNFRNIFRNAVGAVGHYGEIYARNAENENPRGGLNLLNTELTTPQFYPLPGIM